MAQNSSSTSELTIDVTCTPRNRANLRRLKTSSIQSFQRWEKENELLYAMIEDESSWISSLFPDAFITPELFFYALEDGVILCLLANFIQEMAEGYGARIGKSIPGKKFTFHKSKKGTRESKLFHSRENVDKFLTWCRWHGIPEAILFESNDAVLVEECRTGGREIVICLMEIARRSSQYGIEVPQMIKLEREIDEEELGEIQGCAEEQHGVPLETNTLNTETRGDRSPIDSDSGVESVFEEGDPSSPRLSEFAADETKTVNTSKSMNKFDVEKKPQRVIPKEESHSLLENSQPKTELDRKVCKIAQEYNIKVVHRLKEGKYIILGKTMFVRMLNDHLLVRIGGGWDTLDHYVMTHASKSTASEGITATPPSSFDRKSSGVWSKLVGKVKRRESQPNLTESPVVICKRERPDSSPSVYRLRDRVKKKLSVTEKDEKDISDAIRKIQSSVTEKSFHSPSFTSKTFFQLKNRFDKGRKNSHEYLFDKKNTKKMTDQTIETITGEQQKETESKEQEISTSTLLEIETSRGATEEVTTSTTTVTECSADELGYQKQTEESFPSTDGFLLFDQQPQQSPGESFPATDADDLLSNDNPPFLLSEALHPEQATDGNQANIHRNEGEESQVEIPAFSLDQEDPKSATNFPAEYAQEIQSQPTEISAEAKETAQAPPTLVPDDKEPRPDIEAQFETVHQESLESGQADFGKVAKESDLIKVSSLYKDAEYVPEGNVLPELSQREEQQDVNDHLQTSVKQTETISDKIKQEEDGLPTDVESATQGNDLPELHQREEREVNDHPQVSIEETVAISDKAKQEEDVLPIQLTSDNDVTSSEVKAEIVEVSKEEEKLEDLDQQTGMICDLQSSEMAIKDMKYVSPDTDKEKDDVAEVPEIALPDVVKIDKGEEQEYNERQVPGADVLMPEQWDKDAVSKTREQPEESERPAQITDEISMQDASFEQENVLEIVSVVESTKTYQEDKQLARSADSGEEVPKDESVGSPTQKADTIHPAKEQIAEQNKVEQKEANSILSDTSSAPRVNQKSTTRKAPGTKKDNAKATNSSIAKNLTARKKEDQKPDRSTKSSYTRTSKSTSTTTTPKTKTVSAVTDARSTSATKRPVSAQTQKTGTGASKPGATKTTPKTTPKSSEPRKPPATTTRPSTVKDKKPPASGGNQMSKTIGSRPRSAVSTKSTDKKDGKEAEASSRPLSAKTKSSSGTTKTTVKKTTTTTSKTTGGPTSRSEVSKTTTIASGGGTTSKTKTTVKKSTESGGKTKALKEGTPHQATSVRNNSTEMKRGLHGKPGSASTKLKPTSATTRGKPGSAMAKGKTTSERPKSPTKGTKKSAPTKEETTASAQPIAVTESPAISLLQREAPDVTSPDVTADSKESVTRVIQRTEVIKDDGETEVIQTKEIKETVLENREQQTSTEETVVEESG